MTHDDAEITSAATIVEVIGDIIQYSMYDSSTGAMLFVARYDVDQAISLSATLAEAVSRIRDTE